MMNDVSKSITKTTYLFLEYFLQYFENKCFVTEGSSAGSSRGFRTDFRLKRNNKIKIIFSASSRKEHFLDDFFSKTLN